MDLRLQIFNANRDHMIQVQNGRFLFNWIDSGGSYPSYDTVRPQFDEYWDRFRKFLLRHSEQTLEVNQWEVVYVNQIPKGELWAADSEIPSLFTFLGPAATLENLQLNFETVNGEWAYAIPDNRGRLYVRLGKVQKEDTPHVVLTLTARGPAGESDLLLDKGLELGHETITKAFVELTSSQAQQHWEPIYANSSTE